METQHAVERTRGERRPAAAPWEDGGGWMLRRRRGRPRLGAVPRLHRASQGVSSLQATSAESTCVASWTQHTVLLHDDTGFDDDTLSAFHGLPLHRLVLRWRRHHHGRAHVRTAYRGAVSYHKETPNVSPNVTTTQLPKQLEPAHVQAARQRSALALSTLIAR